MNFRQIKGITKKDKEMVNYINSLIDGYEFSLKSGSDKDYYLHSEDYSRKKNLIRKELERLGLFGKKSKESDSRQLADQKRLAPGY